MKNILLALLLTAFGLGAFAQVPPPAGANSTTNRDELLRRALEKLYAAQTNAPAVPDAAASAVAAPAAPAAPAPVGVPAVGLPQFPTNRLPVKRPRLGNPPPIQTLPSVAAAPAAPAAAVPTPVTPVPVVLEPGAVVITATPASAISDPDKIYPAGNINFTAAPLEKVLEIYAEFVGRNLLRPAVLPKADIVLQQTTPLTKLEIIHALEAALALNQISVVNVGDKFVTVVATTEANQIAGRLNTSDVTELPDLGSIITRVVQLKYTKPTELVSVLQPFASGKVAAPVQPIDGSGMLVLRDNVANVKRMLEMIEKVDVTMPSEFLSEVIPIKYAKAEEIASALSSVGGGTGGTVGSRPTSTGSGAAGGASRFGQPGYNPNQPGGLNQPGAIPTPSSGSSFSDRLQKIIRNASSAGDIQILGTTKIIADIRSNALLVFATRQDMETIKDIIKKLDVVLAQVLIETVIMDVSLSDSTSLGISYLQNPKSVGNKTIAGGLNNVGFLTPDNFGTATNGVAALGKGLSYFGRFGQDLDVTLTAIASDSSVKVIQKPRIMTSHATPGKIFIGSTVPYVQSTYYGGGFGGGPSSSYSQLKVGIDLSVTPFINQDGLVVMKIEEAIDELGKPVPITGVGDVPSTVSRTLSGEIAVRDRETIVLGGFIRTSGSDGKSGVPLLKDIPLIGILFTSTTKSKDRSELIVLMRPTVLQTPELAAAYTSEEKSRLPGVRRAEAESIAEEKRQVKAADRDLEPERRVKVIVPKKTFNQVTPFTPEEEKLYAP